MLVIVDLPPPVYGAIWRGLTQAAWKTPWWWQGRQTGGSTSARHSTARSRRGSGAAYVEGARLGSRTGVLPCPSLGVCHGLRHGLRNGGRHDGGGARGGWRRRRRRAVLGRQKGITASRHHGASRGITHCCWFPTCAELVPTTRRATDSRSHSNFIMAGGGEETSAGSGREETSEFECGSE